MKYQIQQVTLETGNPIHLPHALYVDATSLDDAAGQMCEIFEVFGAKVVELEAALKVETVQHWKRKPKDPGLFEDGDLKAQRKPSAPPSAPTPAHPDDWEFEGKAPDGRDLKAGRGTVTQIEATAVKQIEAPKKGKKRGGGDASESESV